MLLLDAINYVLPKLGEHQVTSTDSRSPTLRILLQLFDMHRRSLLGKGWWFNDFTVDLHPGVTGEIEIPADTLSCTPLYSRYGIGRKGGKLFNVQEQSYTFTEPVRVRVVQDTDWEELPEAMQKWIMYQVLIDQTVTDAGITGETQLWEREMQEAKQQLLSEHLRTKRYNTATSPRGRRIISAIRGRP